MNRAAQDEVTTIALPTGALALTGSGGLAVLGPTGAPAVPGDGVATAIARLVMEGGARLPGVEVERTRAGREGTRDLTGHESGLGDGVDATNWNVIVDDAVIVKAALRWDGVHRAPGILAHLTDRAPGLAPELLGTLRVAIPGSRETAPLATVSRLIPHSSDGWTWAVESVLSALDDGQPALDALAWPSEVGALIAELHAALETHASATPSTDDHARAEDRALTDESLASLDALLTGTDDTAERLRRRRSSIRRALDETAPPTGARLPLHGDLHVGQLLRTDGGRLHVIDFDGDPQQPASAAVGDVGIDLAHILTSIDLVGAIVHRRRGGGPDPRVDDWCDAARQQLLSAYVARRGTHRDNAVTDARLRGLTARRLIAELRYAEAFLPRWRYAPDYALSRRFALDSDTPGDIAWTPPSSPTTSS